MQGVLDKSMIFSLSSKNLPLLADFLGLSQNDFWKIHSSKIYEYLFSFVQKRVMS